VLTLPNKACGTRAVLIELVWNPGSLFLNHSKLEALEKEGTSVEDGPGSGAHMLFKRRKFITKHAKLKDERSRAPPQTPGPIKAGSHAQTKSLHLLNSGQRFGQQQLTIPFREAGAPGSLDAA
jgi:hypothetical protein